MFYLGFSDFKFLISTGWVLSEEGVEPVLTEADFAGQMSFDAIAEEVEVEEGEVVVDAVAVHVLVDFILFKLGG